MANHKKLLAALAARPALKDRRKELQAIIKKASRQLAKVETSLALSEPIDKVIKGVPISICTQGVGCDMRTVASNANTPERSSLVYQNVHTKHWAVRINEQQYANQRFYGGKVLGLDKSYTRNEALAIAERWLIGDDSVLDT